MDFSSFSFRVTLRVIGVHKGKLELQIGFKRVKLKKADFVVEEKWVQTSDDFGSDWFIRL